MVDKQTNQQDSTTVVGSVANVAARPETVLKGAGTAGTNTASRRPLGSVELAVVVGEFVRVV